MLFKSPILVPIIVDNDRDNDPLPDSIYRSVPSIHPRHLDHGRTVLVRGVAAASPFPATPVDVYGRRLRWTVGNALFLPDPVDSHRGPQRPPCQCGEVAAAPEEEYGSIWSRPGDPGPLCRILNRRKLSKPRPGQLARPRQFHAAEKPVRRVSARPAQPSRSRAFASLAALP